VRGVCHSGTRHLARASPSSFRDAPLGAGPESITTNVDVARRWGRYALTTGIGGYGFRARSAPRNDENVVAAEWHDGQDSASRRPQISGLTPAVPFRQEGRSRVVTNAGWDVVDARASARTAVAGRVEPRERLQARKTNDVVAYGKTVWS